MLLGPQKSTPLSRMRNWVAVSSREFEGPRILDRAYVWISSRHSLFQWKSYVFVAYIRKFCIWGFRNLHPSRGSEIEGWFPRGNSRVKSRTLGVQASESMDFQRKVMILCNTFVSFLKNLWFRCIHLKILLLGPQKSTPLSRIRNWMAILSREFEGQVANLR